ncbi:MAG TPA: D-alanyl-D-alanine carboxypeptidase/D-alanyl-D-alanine-endopeptidase [Tepidisphaeraceae bacterium]|jgi:D-alanyl-D-alanine carboxypeptidase/D-alanyl-D-alanine-endopeptidase (penicillin-binding protein 4)|nr:D-alanyl-D-alanine carboxypeptidase/D-alanyl-D-alanine-endopeptidase [Tepidisphaeraceae bacterium]
MRKSFIGSAILMSVMAVAGCSHQAPMSFGQASDRQSDDLKTRLHTALHERDSSGAILAARVIDLNTHQELFAENLDRPMKPASNLKLFTTSATLDRFGPKHTFDTYLAMDGDDLWIIGTGDPSLGDPKIAKKKHESQLAAFDRWAATLKSKGITEIKGKLYYYDGAFDAETVHPSWSRGDLTDWYAAPVTGLNFNDNCIDVSVTPTEPGKPVTYEVMPPLADLHITNEMTTGGKFVEEPIDRKDKSMNWYLTGGDPEKKTLGSKCVPYPGAFFADAMRTHFEKLGIHIDGVTERAEKPLDGKLIPPANKTLLVERSPLPQVLNRLTKDSQNLFAEAFNKSLGRQWDLDHGRDVPGSWKSGSEAVHAFLQKNHIDDSGVKLVDGSGLSHEDRITARAMSEMLATMHTHPYSKTFFEALPIGGVDGTIGKRMKDIAGKIHAKTGYINGVRSLSGYAQAANGHMLVFTFVYNQIPGSVAPFEELQDNACRLLVAYPDVENAHLKPTTRPARGK